ncbi:MAG: hypothetical protein JWN83_234, partial [Chitinophagaceae bacterium]|nr:hypothetical protein [Chitinophagaceae bacterium]
MVKKVQRFKLHLSGLAAKFIIIIICPNTVIIRSKSSIATGALYFVICNIYKASKQQMRYPCILLLVLLKNAAFSQGIDSIIIKEFPDKYFSKVDDKISFLDEKLTKQTGKYIQKLQRQEDKIKRRLGKIDSSTSAAFENSKQKYTELSQSIKSKTATVSKITGGQYNSYLDSLGTSLHFLQQFKEVSDKVKDPLKNLQQLQSKLQHTEQIKKYITERKEQIKQLLSKYTNIPKGLQKQYEQLSKTAYYYSAQVKEYKELLKDPEKIEKKALALLNKLPAFQKFMKENSQLASLFQIPGGSTSPANLAGLQTRATVQTMIAQQISMGGANAQAQIQQNLAHAHAEINKLKDKINQLGGGSSDMEMPDFKPNDQKPKSFLKRLEFGSNIQSQKSTYFFPATTDIGLSVGYKLNDKSTLGI